MNQGIRRSLRHAGLTMLVIGGLAGLIVGAAFDCKIGIGVGFVVGIGFAFVNGGHACLQHFGLRLLIWANDFGPLNYAPFLEHCRTLTFLRRKLTGYTFFHPLFKEHLAKIENLSVFKVPNSPR